MVKVSIELQHGTARFTVALKAHSVQQALSIVAARQPSSVAKVKSPIYPESFLVKDSAA